MNKKNYYVFWFVLLIIVLTMIVLINKIRSISWVSTLDKMNKDIDIMSWYVYDMNIVKTKLENERDLLNKKIAEKAVLIDNKTKEMGSLTKERDKLKDSMTVVKDFTTKK